MDAAEKLIIEFYRCAAVDEWHLFRVRAFERLCRFLAAETGLWWSRARNHGDGELTQYPGSISSTERVREMLARHGESDGLVRIDDERDGGVTYLLTYTHQGGLMTTLVLSFASGTTAPDPEMVLRLAAHIGESSELAIRYFIGRDDWLHASGRPSRGSAALVDAAGRIYVASSRFYSLLAMKSSDDQLPFDLPEPVLARTASSFFQGALRFRVSWNGALVLLHARSPMPLDTLSAREQEIARALGSGKTFKSVARQYGIAASTVANHASRIYRKLDIFRREELVELLRAPDGAGQATKRGKP